MEKELNKLIDSGEITWLPWIGRNYYENRILLLGESHRCDNTQKSIEKHKNSEFTQTCVNEMGVNKKEGTVKFYKNIHKLLSKADKKETQQFWHKVSFMNIVQRPMKHVDKKRRGPTLKDYKDGWLSTLEVINILNPKIVICFSLSSADKIEKALKEGSFRLKYHKWLYKIKGCYAKKAVVYNKKNEEINIIFVKHPSRINNDEVEEWQLYLRNELSKDQQKDLF